MTNRNKIRGLIYEQFKSERQLAEALGWSQQHLNKALKRPERLRIEQAQKIIQILGLTEHPDRYDIFLPCDTTECGNNPQDIGVIENEAV